MEKRLKSSFVAMLVIVIGFNAPKKGLVRWPSLKCFVPFFE